MCLGLFNKRLCEDRSDRFQISWKVSHSRRRASAMIHANWHLLFEVPFSGEPLNGYFSYNPVWCNTTHTLSCDDNVLTLWLSVYRYVTTKCAQVCGVACARPHGDDKAYHESLATTAKLTNDNKKCIPLRSSETKHKAHTFTFSSVLTSGPVFSLFRWVFLIYSTFTELLTRPLGDDSQWYLSILWLLMIRIHFNIVFFPSLTTISSHFSDAINILTLFFLS